MCKHLHVLVGILNAFKSRPYWYYIAENAVAEIYRTYRRRLLYSGGITDFIAPREGEKYEKRPLGQRIWREE